MKNVLFLCFAITSLSLDAQTHVQNFTLTNVADGTTLSLETYSNAAGVVVLFTSNECPYDHYYLDRIKNLINTYSGKIQFLLINSYQEPEESEDKMKEAFGKWGLNAPYLADKDQTLMTSLGAKKSPEVFLLKNEGKEHVIIYSGAIDDNPQMGTAVNQPHLKIAIDKLLSTNRLEILSERAVGCTIRRK